MRTYFRLTSFVLALLAATQVAGQTMEARKPFRKPIDRHLTATENATGEIVVKFHDHVRARVSPSGALKFLGNGDVRAAHRLLKKCTLQPALKMSPVELDALEAEAFANSGKAQPDLAGLISVRVADTDDKMGIERLARRLNSLDSVEFATIKHSLKISSNAPYGGYCQLPVVPLLCVQVASQPECDALGGAFSTTPCAAQPVEQIVGPCCLEAPIDWPLDQPPPTQYVATCVDTTYENCLALGGLPNENEFRGVFAWEDADENDIASPDEISVNENDSGIQAFTCNDSARGPCPYFDGDVFTAPDGAKYEQNNIRGDGSITDPTNPDNYPFAPPVTPGLVFDDPNGFHGAYENPLRPSDIDADSILNGSYGACCLGAGTMFDNGGACVDLTLYDCFRAGGIWRQPDAFLSQTSDWSADDQGSCVTLEIDEDTGELDIADEYECEFEEDAGCEALGILGDQEDDRFNGFQRYYECFFNETGVVPWAVTNLSPSRANELAGDIPGLPDGGPSCSTRACCDAVSAVNPDCALQWSVECVLLAKSLPDCPTTNLTAATGLYVGNVYMPYRDEPTSGDFRTPVDVELVQLVLGFDPDCLTSWDMTCAEYARLFSHRLNVIGDPDTSKRPTPDLTGLQHNLSAEAFNFEQTPVRDVLAKLDLSSASIDPADVAKARFIRSLPRADITPARTVSAFSGQGLGVRGLPGESHTDGLDPDGDGIFESEEEDTRSPGSWQVGERFEDYGLDGVQGVYQVGQIYATPDTPIDVTCVPVQLNMVAIADQVYGDSLDYFIDDPNTPDVEIPGDLGFAYGISGCEPGSDCILQLGEPFPCELLTLTVNVCGEDVPVYNDPSRGRDYASNDEGECDGLYTRGTGGAEYAIKWARDNDFNGGTQSIYDRSGLLSVDGRYNTDGKLIDEGDELFRGRGARIGVIDFSYYRGHEDLDQPDYEWKRFALSSGAAAASNYEPRKPYVILEEGQTLLKFSEIAYPDHGTAVLGQLSALDEARDWVVDGSPMQSKGITGIVPEAQPYFFPLVSVEDGPRELTAWSKAIRTFGPGDIICAAYEPTGLSTTLVASPDVVLLSQVAFDKGILVVVAAGNGRQDIDLEAADAGVDTEGELGMCVVASSTFFETGEGITTYSNPATTDADIPNGYRARGSNFGTLVDLHFWDEYNVSCGYGDLYSSLDERSGPAGGGNLGNLIDRRRSYTGHFGGTSAAATNIAGAACALNGLARQLYGVPATPSGMRDVALKPYTVEQPYDSNANPLGFACNQLSTDPNRRLVFPLDTCGCDVPDCNVVVSMGWRPRIWEFGRDDCAVVQVANNLNGAVFANDAQSLLAYYVIKGEDEGNFFSLKGDDGARLDLFSEFAFGSEGGTVGGDLSGAFGGAAAPSSFNKVVRAASRPVTGEVTDVLLLAECPVEPSIVTSITAEVQVLPPAAEFMLFGFQLWDARNNRWRLVDVELLPEEEGDPDLTIELEAFTGFGTAESYIDRDQRTWARVWTWTLDSLFGSLDGDLKVSYDLIDIQYNFGPDNGGGG